jgi:hypothetical protein
MKQLPVAGCQLPVGSLFLNYYFILKGGAIKVKNN